MTIRNEDVAAVRVTSRKGGRATIEAIGRDGSILLELVMATAIWQRIANNGHECTYYGGGSLRATFELGEADGKA